MLTFQTIHDVSAWDEIKSEWNQLVGQSTCDVPFLYQEFLRDWWVTLGGGEWKDGTLVIVTAREEGNLVGAAPLFLTRNKQNLQALMFVGSYEIIDYLDFVVLPERLEEFLSGFMDYLQRDQVLHWDVLDLYNILNTSPTLATLEKLSPGLPWHYRQEVLQPAPYVPLPGNWETYLAGIDKKQRHEIRRKMRRAEESGYQTGLYFTTNPDRLEADIRCFLRLMAQDGDKESFLTDPMREQMAQVIRTAFKKGWLQLAFLEIGGERASAYLSFMYRNRLWVYNSGINLQLIEYSPGWVLLGYLLKWCTENGYSEFDFMRGNEEYKYRFGAVNRFVHRVTFEKKAPK